MEYHIKGEFDDDKPELIFCQGKRVGEVDGEENLFHIEGRKFKVSGFLILKCRDVRTGKVLGTYHRSLVNYFWDAGATDTLNVAGHRYTVEHGEDVTRVIVRDRAGHEVLLCNQDDDDEIETTARFASGNVRDEHLAMLSLVFFAYYTNKRWSD